jgi:hypothetical protein
VDYALHEVKTPATAVAFEEFELEATEQLPACVNCTLVRVGELLLPRPPQWSY